MATDLPAFEGGALRATATLHDDVLAFVLEGTAESEVSVGLTRWLAGLHAEAVKCSARRATVDFRQLDFMTSSCFKAFVTWIGNVQDLPPAMRYQIHFWVSPEKSWQSRSVDALCGFAPGAVSSGVS